MGKPGAKDTGGMSTYLRELSLALGKLDHRVDLFTGAGGCTQVEITEVGPNSRLITLPAASGCEDKLKMYAHLDQFAADLEHFRREENQDYDLIFSHYWLSGWTGQTIKELWGVPHLVMFHTLGAVKNASCSEENEPDLRIKAEKTVSRDCDRVIVAARREKQALIRYYGAPPEKVTVIPCGVNLELFQPLAQDKARELAGLGVEKIILCVGRIEPVKGLELLLRAAACLWKQGYAFRLLIAGGDEHSLSAVRLYQQLAFDLGIGERVNFLGLLEHRKLPLYYSAADVTVIPSHYESFGMTALESLACGTPVAATDVGDLKEIIRQGRTGTVIGEHTPEQLAAAAAGFITLSAKPVDLCRDSVLSYGWPEIARQFTDECGKMLS